MSETAPARKAGRPRSAQSHQALLDATLRLMADQPIRNVTINAIAREAGVGKTTIYRWWDSKCAIVMDAFLSVTAPKIPAPDDGPAVANLVVQARELVALLSGPTGRTVAEMVGEGQADPHILDEFRQRFFKPLLEPSLELIERGKREGEIDPALDSCLALDLIFGPVYYRLLVGHLPLDDTFADELAARVPVLLTD